MDRHSRHERQTTGPRSWALCTPLLLAFSGLTVAQPATEVAATFNPHFLRGQAQQIDMGQFRHGNPVLAGNHLLDLYVNDRWQGQRTLTFRAAPGQASATTCFSRSDLMQLGVDLNTVPPSDEACRPLEEWLPGAYTEYNQTDLKLTLNIPQAYLSRSPRGHVDPSLWDEGINAGFISYNMNAFHTERDLVTGRERQDTGYMMLNSGINLGPWQLRHDSNARYRSGEGSDWQNTATYLRRPLPGIRAIVTLGDTFTEGNLFDAIGFRGIRLATDDRMLPDSLRGYAPIVRGVAETNAMVEVRQNGQVLYQTTVSPGPFVIDDLYPTGYGGDLEVIITEADGRERRFLQPFASLPQLLRPGIHRYSLVSGRVRETELRDDPWLAQGTYQRGLNNWLTAYAGTTFSDDYQAHLGGVAVSTPLGAFSLDVTHSQTDFDRNATRRGQSYKISYSRMLQDWGTQFTVAAYRYSTDGYLTLRDAIRAHELEQRALSLGALQRQRSEFQLTLNQNLGQRLGALYITGSVRDYWEADGTTTQFQLGYNNSWQEISYGIDIQHTEDSIGDRDVRYSLSLSVPLDRLRGQNHMQLSATTRDSRYESSRLGVSGVAGPDRNLTYNFSVADQREQPVTSEVSAEYRAPATSLRGSYSHSSDYRQMGVGLSGAVIAHGGGITFAPQRGETMVVISAPAAAGARVANMPGLRVDERGYALIPYVSPYRLNTITLDPNGMDRQVELTTNQQRIAPLAGAVSRVSFETRRGWPLLIRARRDQGEPVPFGATVRDEQGQPVGVVAQGSRAYLRTEAPRGTLTIQWGDDQTQQCTLHYQLPAEITSEQSYLHVEADCD